MREIPAPSPAQPKETLLALPAGLALLSSLDLALVKGRQLAVHIGRAPCGSIRMASISIGESFDK